MNDAYDLERFVSAQDEVYPDVLRELAGGSKRGHWMWFIFPQIDGLGESLAARRYAIRSCAEAKAYVAHPTLGPRLRECTDLLVGAEHTDIQRVLGKLDTMKFRSCMTLFKRCTDEEIFRRALDAYFDGTPDEVTLQILDRH